jgi:hypothetical protein
MSFRCRGLMVLSLFALVGGTASAAEVDKYLPEDVNAVVSLNVRQVIDSPLFKKNYLPLIQKELKAKPEVQKQLKDLNFDPLRDLDGVVLGLAESCEPEGSNKDPGLFLILHGRFDTAKAHAKLAEIAPFVPKLLQIHKKGSSIVYELTLEEKTLYFALPDRTSIVLSGRKEPVIEALDRATARKKVTLKSEDVGKLIAKTDAKQALWVVATGKTSVEFQTILVGAKKGEKARKTLEDSGVTEVTGGFWVTDGVKAAFGVEVQNGLIAKAVANGLQDELSKQIKNEFDGKLEGPLAPVREFLRDLVIAADGYHIVIQGEVAGRVFVDSLK